VARGRLIAWLRAQPYRLTVAALWPINIVLAAARAQQVDRGSVLHISYLGHVPHHFVHVLRRHGIRADYLAVGDSATWHASDYRTPTPSRWPWLTAWAEFRFFWRVVSRYEIVHAHFMVTMSRSGWEIAVLKRMGRGLVVHYRGCEARDRGRNMQLHPAVNICQECDYDPYVCRADHNVLRRRLARRYADATLVTTPDLKDFQPDARHLRFFTPDAPTEATQRSRPPGTLKIVHATNHPGIEGTRYIVSAVEALRVKGIDIELVLLQGVTQARVMAELGDADLSIGKMKMGYYANAQIESLAAGVPAITFVRPEFETKQLRDSGLILTSLDALEQTIEYYARHPDALAEKKAKARSSLQLLHNNAAIVAELASTYDEVRRSLAKPR
jgi:hypothetical protein